MKQKLDSLSREKLLELLRHQDREISSLSNHVKSLKSSIKRLKSRLSNLKSQIFNLKSSVFGKKSEKTKVEKGKSDSNSANDNSLNNSNEQKNNNGDNKKKKQRQRSFPDHLARDEVHNYLDDSQLDCECGGKLKEFSEEASEFIDIIPAKIRIRKNINHKYCCTRCSKNIKRATPAIKPLFPCRATNRFISHVITQKFVMHLPYYRQSQEFELEGIKISASLMCSHTIRGCNMTSVIVAYLTDDLLLSNYIRSDESTMDVVSDSNYKSYIWCHMTGERRSRIVIYKYSNNRRKENATEFLSSFLGYHQTDGYSGYDEIHAKDGITYVGCLAHARRKFIEICKEKQNKKSPAHKVVKIIASLYEIEKEIKDLPPDKKLDMRQKSSKKIWGNLEAMLLKHQAKQKDSSSKFAKAVNYILNRIEALKVYLEDGILFIDNNDNERAIKPLALGRKNWMFCKSSEGANAAAHFYSITLTCLENGIDPKKYLHFLFDQWNEIKDSPERIKAILPHRIEKAVVNEYDGCMLV